MIEREAENTPQSTMVFVRLQVQNTLEVFDAHVTRGVNSTLNSSSPHQALPSLKEELEYFTKCVHYSSHRLEAALESTSVQVPEYCQVSGLMDGSLTA